MELKIPAGLCFTRHKAATNVQRIGFKFPQRAGSLHIFQMPFRDARRRYLKIKETLNFRDRSPMGATVKMWSPGHGYPMRSKSERLTVHQKCRSLFTFDKPETSGTGRIFDISDPGIRLSYRLLSRWSDVI